MSVTTTCRDINELTPNAKLACQLLFQECFKAGITDIFITETYRSQARQKYLYEQGRTRPGQIVTWTLNSNHASRRAWDIAVAPPKSLYDVATLNRVGAIAKKLGITWGGNWKNIDRPHFEIPTNWKAPIELEGTVVVPTSSKDRVQFTKKGGLTVNEVNRLQSQINELNATVKSLQSQLDNKANTRVDGPVSSWAKEFYDWGVTAGLTDGSNPRGALTREQALTMLNRLYEKIMREVK